jgi:hypothetical protein
VSLSREVAKEAKLQNKRRGVRVNSRVPLTVAWRTDRGLLRTDAHTRIVGPYGCLAVIAQELCLEQRLEIINCANERANAAVVVWKGKTRLEGWEYGIELIEPEMDFWGLEL